MTKEQEESIDYVQKQIDYFKKQIKFIEAVDRTYYESEYRLYKNRVKQFETVLNMLKEKDADIEEYKRMIAAGIINAAKDELVQEKNKELEKKDKIIDLMSEQIKIPEPIIKIESFDIKPKTKFGMRYLNKEEVKQYFERKIIE